MVGTAIMSAVLTAAYFHNQREQRVDSRASIQQEEKEQEEEGQEEDYLLPGFENDFQEKPQAFQFKSLNKSAMEIEKWVIQYIKSNIK